MRRAIPWLLLLAAIVATALLLTRKEAPLVTPHTVGRGLVESTVANTRAGTVNANRRAKLAPSSGGQVEFLHVKEGDRVKAGQVLVELWHADLDAQLALARAEAVRAEALAAQAKVEAELAEREAQRQQDLGKQDISAEGAVDRMVTASAAARSQQAAATAEADARKRQIEAIEAQITRMRVVAPFAGIVAEVNAEVGEFVTPSPVGIPTPPAIDLIDDGAPYVTAPIDEVDAARVRVGMTARVTLDAFGKRPFAGKVRRIAPYVLDREKQARTVDVEVEFAEPPADARLLPGYSADVEILIAAKDDVLRVPTECLREGNVVLVIGADRVLAARTVEVGLANWRFTEVPRGLEPGDRIVGSLDQKGLAAGIAVRLEGAAADRP
ncbi:MAG: efflux RND transporter periplasmic adaptor subunit [Planctomycetes bacterium]|nr:efflux RND transporter periplasmic adaptor subunit [Planctomycetota bacterium]